MPLYLINDFNIVCITDRTSFKPGAAPRGGDVPPLRLRRGKGGKRRRTVLGPKGPKIRKKWISTGFLPLFEIQKAFESSF